MTRDELLDYNESLVRQHNDLDGNATPEESERLLDEIATTEAMLLRMPEAACCKRAIWRD